MATALLLACLAAHFCSVIGSTTCDHRGGDGVATRSSMLHASEKLLLQVNSKLVLPESEPANQTGLPWISRLAVNGVALVRSNLDRFVPKVQGADVDHTTDSYPNKLDEYRKEIVASTALWALLTGLVAIFYVRETTFPPEKKPGEHTLTEGEWHFSLCSCFDEPRKSAIACCFLPIRWADNMRMAGFMGFGVALGLMLGLAVLNSMIGLSSLVLVVILTYYRQQLRAKFNIRNGDCSTLTLDCCIATFLPCCMVVQEARQLDQAYQAGHPAMSGMQP